MAPRVDTGAPSDCFTLTSVNRSNQRNGQRWSPAVHLRPRAGGPMREVAYRDMVMQIVDLGTGESLALPPTPARSSPPGRAPWA